MSIHNMLKHERETFSSSETLNLLLETDQWRRGEFFWQIDLQFIGLLVTFCKVLGYAKCLSDVLQSSTLDLARAVDLVGAFIDTLQEYRTDNYLVNYGKRLRSLLSSAKLCTTTPSKISKDKFKIF